MKVAVVGANGQLGSDLVKVFKEKGEEVLPLFHSELEVSQLSSCEKALTEKAPEIIINTAAFHRVDDCEQEPEKAFAVNTQGAFNLAKVGRDLGAKTVFLSTDYVFSGKTKKAYPEDARPDPVNIYGVSKAAGEIWVKGLAPENLIVRTSGLFGQTVSKKGWNFVEKMIRLAKEKGSLKVVDDQLVSPTFTLKLAEKIYQLVKAGSSGIYHLTSSGFCSWHGFTQKILDFAGIKCELSAVSSEEFKTPAERPAFCVLADTRLEAEGFSPLPPWEEALREYLLKQGHLK